MSIGPNNFARFPAWSQMQKNQFRCVLHCLERPLRVSSEKTHQTLTRTPEFVPQWGPPCLRQQPLLRRGPHRD